MARILVVEDCPDAQALTRRALAGAHEVDLAETVEEALGRARKGAYDLAVVDLGLPDGDGFGVCSVLQNDPDTASVPVIFLTASTNTRDKVTAFRLGADDFIEKPFEPDELRARVEARIRKSQERERRDQHIELGDLGLDLAKFRAFRLDPSGAPGSAGESMLDLTPRELRLLHYLGERKGEVVARNLILGAVWGEVVVSRRTVDTHVSNLRRKLAGTRVEIEGVRGIGYRLTLRPASPAAS